DNSSMQASESHNAEAKKSDNEDMPLSETGSVPQTSCPIRYKKHKTTVVEEQILKQLEDYKDSSVLASDIINELVERLSNYNDYWTSVRIRSRWYN
ncbi:7369_t:CDS:1, partial [Scutellospora calospora]